MRTVALVGPTAAGKSTICEALAQTAAVSVLACDDFYKPHHICPTFELGALPWPRHTVPAPFAERGSADLNAPDAIDWERLCEAIRERQREITALHSDLEQAPTLLVEGHLLLSEHPGAAAARALYSHLAIIDADDADRRAMDALLRRKWVRSHWGKRSYRDRGVTEDEYVAYWDHYVWPAWKANKSAPAPADSLQLDAMQPVEENVQRLLSTGWFPSKPRIDQLPDVLAVDSLQIPQ
mgnify:CR=1 FL=1